MKIISHGQTVRSHILHNLSQDTILGGVVSAIQTTPPLYDMPQTGTAQASDPSRIAGSRNTTIKSNQAQKKLKVDNRDERG
jgi:hypothetical protein